MRKHVRLLVQVSESRQEDQRIQSQKSAFKAALPLPPYLSDLEQVIKSFWPPALPSCKMKDIPEAFQSPLLDS